MTRRDDDNRVVGFTGTRNGMTKAQKGAVKDLLLRLKPTMVHHGGCVGADIDFDDLCFQLKIECVIHPSDMKSMQGVWHIPAQLREEHPPLERNRHIVDETTLLIATPAGVNKVLRSGTWYTIGLAQAGGKVACIVYPDGHVEVDRPKLVGPKYWSLY